MVYCLHKVSIIIDIESQSPCRIIHFFMLLTIHINFECFMHACNWKPHFQRKFYFFNDYTSETIVIVTILIFFYCSFSYFFIICMKTFLNFSILLAEVHYQDENVNCGISLLLSLVISHRCFISLLLFYLIVLSHIVNRCFSLFYVYVVGAPLRGQHLYTRILW